MIERRRLGRYGDRSLNRALSARQQSIGLALRRRCLKEESSDPFDGSESRGITIDEFKKQVLVMQWLGTLNGGKSLLFPMMYELSFPNFINNER